MTSCFEDVVQPCVRLLFTQNKPPIRARTRQARQSERGNYVAVRLYAYTKSTGRGIASVQPLSLWWFTLPSDLLFVWVRSTALERERRGEVGWYLKGG